MPIALRIRKKKDRRRISNSADTKAKGRNMDEKMPAPVIIDTDIGQDIDDIWAIAMIRGIPQIDVRLVTTATGDTYKRAAMAIKLLRLMGRIDIPVAAGIKVSGSLGAQQPWLEEFDIDSCSSVICTDYAGKIADIIRSSHVPVSIVGIAPLTNIAAFIDAYPDLISKCKFIGMLGSLQRNYDDREGAIAEYNIVQDIEAAQKVLRADWLDCLITPLDTCGSVRIEGEFYRQLKESKDPLISEIIKAYKIWSSGVDMPDESDFRTSVLYDTVAVYLAAEQEYLNIEELNIIVDDDGMMEVNNDGKSIRCATSWKDKEGFIEYLLSVLNHSL